MPSTARTALTAHLASADIVTLITALETLDNLGTAAADAERRARAEVTGELADRIPAVADALNTWDTADDDDRTAARCALDAAVLAIVRGDLD